MVQWLIVIVIIGAALAYAGSTLLKKRHAFTNKRGCGGDCGCSSSSKKLRS